MDELFSPVQQMMDLDMPGCVQKMLDGIPVENYEGDIAETVMEGVRGRYLGSDDTLDNMNRYISYPCFMTRKSLPALLRDKEKPMRERAAEKAEQRLRRPPVWKLEEERAQALRALLQRAVMDD